MAAEFVGIVAGAITRRVYAVVNPDDDSELDNPRWLLIQIGHQTTPPPALRPADWPDGMEWNPVTEPDREPIRMLRIPRDLYMTFTSHSQIDDWAREAE